MSRVRGSKNRRRKSEVVQFFAGFTAQNNQNCSLPDKVIHSVKTHNISVFNTVNMSTCFVSLNFRQILKLLYSSSGYFKGYLTVFYGSAIPE